MFRRIFTYVNFLFRCHRCLDHRQTFKGFGHIQIDAVLFEDFVADIKGKFWNSEEYYIIRFKFAEKVWRCIFKYLIGAK
jgi:hypothetical protein